MRKSAFVTGVLLLLVFSGWAQPDSAVRYRKTVKMIPMRDGIKLFTVILTPVAPSGPSPILINRTPYGADIPIPDDSVFSMPRGFPEAASPRKSCKYAASMARCAAGPT